MPGHELAQLAPPVAPDRAGASARPSGPWCRSRSRPRGRRGRRSSAARRRPRRAGDRAPRRRREVEAPESRVSVRDEERVAVDPAGGRGELAEIPARAASPSRLSSAPPRMSNQKSCCRSGCQSAPSPSSQRRSSKTSIAGSPVIRRRAGRSSRGRGRSAKRHLRMRPGHDVEVVELVAVGRAAGVVALGHQRHVVVLDRHRLVERAVLGVDPLDGEALRRGSGACSRSPRDRSSAGSRPRRGGGSGSDDQCPAGVKTSVTRRRVRDVAPLHGDVVDVAGVGPLAARRELDPLGAEPLRPRARPAPARCRRRGCSAVVATASQSVPFGR